MLYVDTSILVTPILENQSGDKVQACRRFLEEAVSSGTPLATSWLTWDEFVWAVGKAGGSFDHQRAHEAGESLLEFPYLRFLAVDRIVVERATQLLGNTSSRPRDCIHAASALLHCGGDIVSLDSDFGKEKVALLGVKLRSP
jgi:predicted nucleic acid-binding protein